MEQDIESLIRPVNGIYVSFASLVGAMYLVTLDRAKRYYHIIILVSFLSIWITATRGWILASSLVLLPYLFMVFNRKWIANILLVFFIFILLISQVSFFNRQFFSAFDRLATVVLVAEGDETAGGTLDRLDKRSDPVWDKFLENPLIGTGFSEDYYQYADPHVGNQNLLFNTGIVGASLFIILILTYLIYSYKVATNFPRLRFTSLTLGTSIMGIVIIHSSSAQMFGFDRGFQAPFMIAMLFTILNYVHNNSKSLIEGK
jgi:hypothetical protein